MDAFPMIVACFKGQQPEGGSDLMGPNICLNCTEITHFARKFCSLCHLREELGLISLKYPEVNIVYG